MVGNIRNSINHTLDSIHTKVLFTFKFNSLRSSVMYDLIYQYKRLEILNQSILDTYLVIATVATASQLDMTRENNQKRPLENRVT